MYPIIWYACNITINVTITFQVLCCLEQNWLFHQPVLLNVTLDIHMSRQFPIIKIYPSSKSLWNSFYYDVVIIYTFALPLMPNTSILSFWQLFLNPASPNNYMSVSKRNTSIMRNSCSSLSTSFALHKRTWVFVWWRYKSCCWVVKQQPIKTLSYYAFKIDYTCIENNAMYLENRRNVQLPYLTK